MMPHREQKSTITLYSQILQLYLDTINVLNMTHLKESINIKSATLISMCLFYTEFYHCLELRLSS